MRYMTVHGNLKQNTIGTVMTSLQHACSGYNVVIMNLMHLVIYEQYKQYKRLLRLKCRNAETYKRYKLYKPVCKNTF